MPLWLLLLPFLLQFLHPLHFLLGFFLLVLSLLCYLLFPRNTEKEQEHWTKRVVVSQCSEWLNIWFIGYLFMTSVINHRWVRSILWFRLCAPIDLTLFSFFHQFEILQWNHFSIPISREGYSCSLVLSVNLLNLSLIQSAKKSSL